MTAPLTALLERVEAATGPDRELDIAIWRVFIRPDVPDGKVPLPWDHCFTASVDAALALVERVLPGRFWSVGFLDEDVAHQEHHKFGALIFPYFRVADPSDGLGHGATPALAILAATLRALHALASRDAAGPADAEGVEN